MVDLVKLIINGKEVEAPVGSTILQAAEMAGVEIPRLCYDKDLSPLGACRLCVVEVKGNRLLPAACVTPVYQGMEVDTDSPAVVEARKTILELLIANHPLDCLTCEKAGACKLQDYCYRYGVKESPFAGEKHDYAIDDSNPFIVRDLNKCILCGACVRACEELTGADNLSYLNRGFHRKATTAGDVDYIDADIANCLYAGIIMDTSSFMNSNTSSTTMRIAAELLDLGADLNQARNRLLESKPLAEVLLLGLGLQNLEFHQEGQIAFMILPYQGIKTIDALDVHPEGLINYLRSIEGVEVAILLREVSPGLIKISFRSKDKMDVAALASRLNGGGHKRAAGAKKTGNLDEVKRLLLEMIEDVLK